MKDKTELIITVLSIALIMAICDIAYLKHESSFIQMNGERFVFAGLAEGVNPLDGEHIFTPVYKKLPKGEI